ncbi:MAG: 3-methylornithine--L-lysine ligase PylC [Deltaproteobacteria bacterium]|jgi:pyrrolysine biosynthesis protein PylC|nr:3-methylornithine--L-lysine ligase PylC [Deltaproteobacteria bacterium]
MRLLCLGAGLQGLEVAYLALKAGWEVTLVDRRKAPPASGLAKTLRVDLASLGPFQMAVLCSGYDLIVPALEDSRLLETLAGARAEGRIPPLALDIGAYRLSSSKILSKKLFSALGLPQAEAWAPGAKGAFIAKPSSLSGSRGVRFLRDSLEVLEAFPSPGDRDGLVIEEWLDGPSYSVEVTAVSGQARSFQVTLLGMDDVYDCCRVTAPSGLSASQERQLKSMAERLAMEMSLTGLMDLEAILCRGRFRLLEIDARFPSQTPMAVFWSTGVNLLVELAACFVGLPPGTPRPAMAARPRKVVFEQVLASAGHVIPQGEHILSGLGPVTLVEGFMGAREALVSGNPKGGHFAATLIRVG